MKTHKNVILTGDININLIPKISELTYERNNRSNYLNMLSPHGYLPGHVLPTREANCLDHFFLKLNKNIVSARVAVVNTTITDHSTVILSLRNLKSSKNCVQKTKTITNYDNALKSLVDKNLSLLHFSDNPNIIIQPLISKITESIQENTRTVKIPRSKRIIKPWIAPGILRCIRNRNKLQKK